MKILNKIKMYVKAYDIIFLIGGDNLKMRDMAMMAMGGALTLAYQKYNKPMMKAMKKTFNQSVDKMNKTLDDMM